MTQSVDLAQALATLDQPWQPFTVAVLNDYDVRVVKVLGEFTRHSHPETDELFLVLSGSLTIRMDAGDVVVKPGQVCVVPKACRTSPPLRTAPRWCSSSPARRSTPATPRAT